MSNLIAWLYSYAFKHKIGVLQIFTKPEYSSLSDKSKRLIIININWKNKKELPFIIGHEIGHILAGEPGLSNYCGTPLTPNERRADLFSLSLIFEYASNQYDSFDEPFLFLQQYGIPIRMLDDACNLFKKHDDLVF
ncbi:hypothetical protein [Lactobacillus panisapium]|uniref:hypothetical protein n=1 Tax=Lactobacillus panisapium TaxID=2012495 RepID=UPI000CDA8C52|nr:hypothetical protein [Lactobacillus panisapium]